MKQTKQGNTQYMLIYSVFPCFVYMYFCMESIYFFLSGSLKDKIHVFIP